MSTVRFREVPKSRIDRVLDHAYLVFHEEDERPGEREFLRRCERTGAYEDDHLVGFLGALPLDLSIPGGQLPCAGLTYVSVAPTHRRRGVLSGMLQEQWRRCAAAGQPLAALWASETAIYGRFGFGAATHLSSVEIDSRRPLALRISPDDRPLRLLDPKEAPAVLGPRYEAGRALRAGRHARDGYWWREQILSEEDEDDDELGPPRIVTLGGNPPAGYAVYRTRAGDDEAGTPGLVHLHELEADTAPVAAALWSYLAGIDLTGKVRAWSRPADDPLLLMATDNDQVQVTGTYPALWLRLVDVPAALAARRYARPVDLALDVQDATLPANQRTFRLTSGPSGTACTPTEDRPDLTLDVRDLAACYLGGVRPVHLLRAGLLTEHTADSVRALDEALRTEYLPFTSDEF
ncbi:GNAT family N-acetyltransferase [Streptomyces orinoci]|uniref:GNAT family N-acetyltransferase n=1 Tax=Streptomyces orinoci TaxID=67339 RepID=A0ABV3JYZ7_STRON|nr:GNAT family N-acetyltransferase [Streptomyces orinoci]